MGNFTSWIILFSDLKRELLDQELLTWLRDIRTAFLFDVMCIGKPLYALAKDVHVRILEDVDYHDHLVKTRKVGKRILLFLTTQEH